MFIEPRPLELTFVYVPPRLWHRNRNGFSLLFPLLSPILVRLATVGRRKVMRKNGQSSSTILVHCHASLCRYADFCLVLIGLPASRHLPMLERSSEGAPPLCQFLGKRYPASLHARSPIGNFFGHAFSLHLKLIKARASDKAARTLPRNYKSQSWAINTSAID